MASSLPPPQNKTKTLSVEQSSSQGQMYQKVPRSGQQHWTGVFFYVLTSVSYPAPGQLGRETCTFKGGGWEVSEGI